MEEVILVDGEPMDDTLEVALGCAQAQPGGEDAALRAWASGQDETTPPRSRMPSAVPSVEIK